MKIAKLSVFYCIMYILHLCYTLFQSCITKFNLCFGTNHNNAIIGNIINKWPSIALWMEEYHSQISQFALGFFIIGLIIVIIKNEIIFEPTGDFKRDDYPSIINGKMTFYAGMAKFIVFILIILAISHIALSGLAGMITEYHYAEHPLNLIFKISAIMAFLVIAIASSKIRSIAKTGIKFFF